MTDESDKPAKKPARVTPPKGTRTVNGGKLNSGGSWPNSGRPPSIIRELAREGLMKAVPNLVRLAAPQEFPNGMPLVKDADQINAASVLARIGLPSQMEVGENPDAPMLTDAQRKARLKELLG